MSPREDEPTHISAGLRRVLNTHGYSFQYAVVRRVHDLHRTGRSNWIFDGTEIPATTAGQITHVDFILRNREERIFVVAECKKADPARSNWCFVRSPYTRRNRQDGEVTFDKLKLTEDGMSREPLLVSEPHFCYTQRGIYQLGFELKTGVPGDGIGGKGPAINDAVSQALRASSGLFNHKYGTIINWLGMEKSLRGGIKTGPFVFIPAIFTTAQLWVTDADIGAADLTTGELPVDAVKVEKADWVWFTHNRSPALGPHLGQRIPTYEWSDALKYEFARTLAIIGPDGTDAFLSEDLEEWIRSHRL